VEAIERTAALADPLQGFVLMVLGRRGIERTAAVAAEQLLAAIGGLVGQVPSHGFLPAKGKAR
jgi:hypothetical protein